MSATKWIKRGDLRLLLSPQKQKKLRVKWGRRARGLRTEKVGKILKDSERVTGI